MEIEDINCEDDNIIPIPFSVLDNSLGEYSSLEIGYYFIIGEITEEDEINIQNGENLNVYAGPYDTEEMAIEAAIEEITNIFQLLMNEVGSGNVNNLNDPVFNVLGVKKVD